MTRLWKILVFLIFTILFFSIPWYILRLESGNIELDNNEYKTEKYESTRSLNFLRTSYANSLTIFDENFAFMEYLSELFRIEVRLLVSRSYDEFGEFLSNSTADIVWGNTEHYLKNRELYKDYIVVMRPVIKGQDKYRGIIIANKDSGIKKVQDLKNKIFSFTDIKSGSGYKLPMELFIDKYNIDIYDFFADVEYLGTHEEVVKSVFYGKVDGGAVFESAPESFLEQSQKEKIIILDHTRYIYNEPVLIKKEIFDKYRNIIEKESFYVLPEKVLKDLKIDGLVRADEKEYIENN